MSILRFIIKKSKKAFIATFIAIVSLLGTSQCFAQKVDPESKQYEELINWVFEYVQRNYVDEVDPEVLYKGAMKGMMDSLKDPHTVYLDAAMQSDLNSTTNGSFGGVGLSISKPIESTSDKPAYVLVASPIEDTPGAKAGIQPGDLIVSIENIDTSTITMEEVLAKLRGTVGEDVHIVIRRGKNMEFPVTLTRAIIEVPTVKYGMIGKTGYLRIIEFTPLTPERVQQAIYSFDDAGYDSLIVDLRNNPGGLLTSVADIADKFIDTGVIVSTKSRLIYENTQFIATPRKTTVKKGIPIVVLINKGSASASEILSGALKDYHLAYLIGERSFGKGSVQKPVPLPNKDGIKLTIAKYYTPSDTNIDKIGIPPDMEVLDPPLSEEAEKAYVDLVKSDEVAKYVESHPNMSEKQIASYATSLKKKYALDERVLRLVVRHEVQKTQPTPLYDLDYDLQLNAALDLIKKGNFATLLQNTKTLKQLQEESQVTKN